MHCLSNLPCEKDTAPRVLKTCQPIFSSIRYLLSKRERLTKFDGNLACSINYWTLAAKPAFRESHSCLLEQKQFCFDINMLHSPQAVGTHVVEINACINLSRYLRTHRDTALPSKACAQLVLPDECNPSHHTTVQDFYTLVSMFQSLHHKMRCMSYLVTSCHNPH